MKALAVSDRVMNHIYDSQVRRIYPDVELLIGCGDLPYYYLEFLISSFDLPLIYVRGNHDDKPQYTSDGRILTRVQGGIDLHGKVRMVNGLLCAGIQGSMRYLPDHHLMYTDREMRREILKLLPRWLWAQRRFKRPVDILVTHSPPFGIHDDTDHPHKGFESFLTLMQLLKPRYLLHGHVHKVGSSIPYRTVYHDTTVINVFPYRQIEI
jgi:Icc-related predicted phosphoesterase